MKPSMLGRREFLKAAGGFAAIGTLSAAPRKPNLLFVLASRWRAPNLVQLARQGVQFQRAYTASPLDSPARATLLTGRFPFACGVPRNDVRLPLDQPSMAQQLKSAGYHTGFIGEWLLDGAEEPGFVPPGLRRRGFDYWAASNKTRPDGNPIYFRDKPEPIHATGVEPDYQTSLAIDFLKQNRQNPFFLFVGWGPLTEARDAPASYDHNVGRLLRSIEEQHLANDTIVVFTSDYGNMLGAHGLEGGDVPFEESTRVPLIISYPRVLEPGRSSDLLISSVDLMPTLLGLCGAAVPNGVQGLDLSDWIATGQGSRPESIYSVGKLGSAGEWRMVVRGLDKLVVDADLNVTYLFNLGQDPLEMENMAHDATQDLKRDELKALLKEWMRRSGDSMDPSGLKKRH
jgi:arylsulfatase A-like enzyme